MISPIGWEFRDPLFLLLGVLAPLVYWLAIHIPSSVTYSSLVLPDSAQRTARVYFSHLPAVLLSIAALCIAFALAGPRTGDATTKVKRTPADNADQHAGRCTRG